MWEQGARFWSSLATLTPGFAPETAAEIPKDRRFADPDWTQNPAFALIRQTYGLLSDQLLEPARQLPGLDAAAREKIDRKRDVAGQCVSVRVDLGGSRII